MFGVWLPLVKGEPYLGTEPTRRCTFVAHSRLAAQQQRHDKYPRPKPSATSTVIYKADTETRLTITANPTVTGAFFASEPTPPVIAAQSSAYTAEQKKTARCLYSPNGYTSPKKADGHCTLMRLSGRRGTPRLHDSINAPACQCQKGIILKKVCCVHTGFTEVCYNGIVGVCAVALPISLIATPVLCCADVLFFSGAVRFGMQSAAGRSRKSGALRNLFRALLRGRCAAERLRERTATRKRSTAADNRAVWRGRRERHRLPWNAAD